MWLDHVVAQRAARRVYWNVNYFGVIRAIAMARAVVGHALYRLHAGRRQSMAVATNSW